jgi:hypothetical protein
MKTGLPATIHWVTIAFSARREILGAVIHVVDSKADETRRFGITVGQRWVVGTDGHQTTFDSPAAARRFLEQLGVDRVEEDVTEQAPDAPRHLRHALYRLRGRSLQKAAPQGAT